MIVDSCLAVFSPKIRKTNYSSARNTHALHTCIPRACRSLPDISDDFEYTPTPMHACVCVCVPWFGLSVWVGSNITSVIHTHIHKLKQTNTLDHARTAPHSLFNTLSLRNTHTCTQRQPHTHTHTQYFHCWRIGRFLQAAGKNVWTNLRRTHVHTTEHFQPTMLTLYSFPEPFYLQAGQVKQRFSIEQYREARLEDCQ